VAFDRAEVAAEGATPIQPGEQEVTVSVEVRFGIGG
jgi:uncharacterized protein YggE